MKKKIFDLILAFAAGFLLAGCGGAGSGGSSPSTGTATMNITDAKPYLPAASVESVSITFDEVSVHRSGGTWVRLATAQQPYTVDLYQFSDGATTQFVPPVRLDAGRYTQVRIGVTSGTIRINGVDHPLEIPSDNLKTDKNFQFDVEAGAAVNLTVDFDLSQSIVLTGSGTYQLKPVLHLVSTEEAWTIRGDILSSSFGTQEAVVVVYRDSNASGAFERGADEEYTRLKVQKSDSQDTQFNVFWLVPDESYHVEVYLGNPDDPPTPEYSQFVNKADPAWSSKTFRLNGGNTFSLGD